MGGTASTMIADISRDLPIGSVLGALTEALFRNTSVVLQAPPGAGKSTLVPLHLLDASWLAGRGILMLAPRRLAARAAAGRMADLLGEEIGQTVGYRVRMDTRIGPDTRIEVVTEGVLTRMLQGDPALERVGLVIFDEFHERSLEADLGLALCLDTQGVLNAGLRLLVMSATIEASAVADLLAAAPVIQCEGQSHDVETRYVGRHMPRNDPPAVANAVLNAAGRETGNILVFLPGNREIQEVGRLLDRSGLGPEWIVAPLIGHLPRVAQDRAISPPPAGRRKIVLATSIAETSLTIEGIRVVVDSGLQRVPRFDVRRGMSRLVTLPVSRDSADQRRGRAGRLGPGICLRLWSRDMHPTLIPARRPDILEADLAGLALELALWGVRHPRELRWLDPPPDAAYAAACELLSKLGALDPTRRITDHGRRMAGLPTHPRLAHMLIMAHAAGAARPACDLAALLSERDPIFFHSGRPEVDLQLRIDLLQSRRRGSDFRLPAARVDSSVCRRIISVSDQLYRRLGPGGDGPEQIDSGRLLAWAYPDRIACKRPGSHGRYLLSGGQGVRLDPDEPMAAQEWLVVADVDGRRQDGRIYRAAAYSEEALREQFADRMQWQEDIQWREERKAVEARRILRMDALTLETRPWSHPPAQRVRTVLLEGIDRHGLEVLPWTKSLRRWQARVAFVRRLPGEADHWPDLTDGCLRETVDQWLAPFLTGISKLRDLVRVDLKSALLGRLSFDQQRRLDILAPTHWTVPSGSRIPIDYGPDLPVLAVRLQEMFGLEQTPTVGGGRRPLLIHLLSPANRPVQVTQDLAGFWQNGYHDVKKELKGRYPKHYWPDDPLQARATARVKPG